MSEIPVKPGTYCLMLKVIRPTWIRVGSLGRFRIGCGVYLYIGSARGVGGLRGRIGRHLRKVKSKRWHIDYLTSSPSVKLVGVSLGVSGAWRERYVVRELVKEEMRPFIVGFGSSDDSALPSHLLASGTSVNVSRRILQRVFSRFFAVRSFLVIPEFRSEPKLS